MLPFSQMYPDTNKILVRHILDQCQGGKGLPSESGWIFLCHDSNLFLEYQYDILRWNEAEQAQALSYIDTARIFLSDLGIATLHSLVPEKSIVYADYLPQPLNLLPISSTRPASILCHQQPVLYFDDVLRAGRSFMDTYHRGDSHPSWFGSFLIYRALAEALAARSLIDPASIFTLAHFLPQLAGFQGDCYSQIVEPLLSRFNQVTRHLARDQFELLISFSLRPEHTTAQPVPPPALYRGICRDREALCFECPNKALPRAVVFRDSTMQKLIPWLSEHFSRSVFIWREGLIFEEVVAQEQPDVVIIMQAERFASTYPRRTPIIRTSGTASFLA